MYIYIFSRSQIPIQIRLRSSSSSPSVREIIIILSTAWTAVHAHNVHFIHCGPALQRITVESVAYASLLARSVE